MWYNVGMETQISLSEFLFGKKRKRTQKEIFFEKMEKIVPLDAWCDIIRPFYYESGNGRQPIALEIMLKMYLVSQWYTLSDPQTEDMLNENMAARKYVGITEDAPDETTLCKFRHILEENDLSRKIFDSLTALLKDKKILMKEGTIVDATIIEAPKSEKNKEKSRDKEMASTFKNNQHHFGIKLHIGIDKDSGFIHSATVTAANKSDIECVNSVLHGEESVVYGDAGYVGIEKREEICEKYQDGTNRKEKQKPSHGKKRPDTFVKREDVKFRINIKRKQVITDEQKEEEKQKSKIRVRVEHTFAVIKHVFGFQKARYRGIKKNENKMLMLCTLANLLRCSQKKLSTI